jgi:Co/Zn/Cd efflux system component
LAIFALLTAKYIGLIWVDPLMGIVGAVLVSRWSFGLLCQTGSVLLDRQGPEHARATLRKCIESDDDSRVADLHLWSVGPNIYSAILSIVTHHPRPPEHYKQLIPSGLGLVHVTVEVRQCPPEGDSNWGGQFPIRAT